jgi:hypothetical protein
MASRVDAVWLISVLRVNTALARRLGSTSNRVNRSGQDLCRLRRRDIGVLGLAPWFVPAGADLVAVATAEHNHLVVVVSLVGRLGVAG